MFANVLECWFPPHPEPSLAGHGPSVRHIPNPRSAAHFVFAPPPVDPIPAAVLQQGGALSQPCHRGCGTPPQASLPKQRDPEHDDRPASSVYCAGLRSCGSIEAAGQQQPVQLAAVGTKIVTFWSLGISAAQDETGATGTVHFEPGGVLFETLESLRDLLKWQPIHGKPCTSVLRDAPTWRRKFGI